MVGKAGAQDCCQCNQSWSALSSVNNLLGENQAAGSEGRARRGHLNSTRAWWGHMPGQGKGCRGAKAEGGVGPGSGPSSAANGLCGFGRALSSLGLFPPLE